MTTLRLFLDESWPDGDAALDWVLLAGDGSVRTHGRGAAADWPAAPAHELILPAGRTLFSRALLPASTRQGGASLFGFALEDSLLNDPAANLYLAGAAASDGRRELAATEAGGLRRALDAVRASGRQVERILPEECLLPLPAADEWCVGACERGYIVRSGELAACFVPAGDAALPLLARLLKHQAPRVIHVCGAGALDILSDAGAWAGWDGAVRPLAGRDWRAAPSDGLPDFAQGELAPRRHWALWRAPLRRAARILLLTLLALVAGLGVRTAWLGWQDARLGAQTTALMQTLTGAADPSSRRALQAVDRLRLARGLPARDDALEAMGALAAAAGGVRAQTLEYRDGRLTVRLASPPATELAAWRERLEQNRYSMQTRSLAADVMELQITREP